MALCWGTTWMWTWGKWKWADIESVMKESHTSTHFHFPQATFQIFSSSRKQWLWCILTVQIKCHSVFILHYLQMKPESGFVQCVPANNRPLRKIIGNHLPALLLNMDTRSITNSMPIMHWGSINPLWYVGKLETHLPLPQDPHTWFFIMPIWVLPPRGWTQ